MAYLTAGCATTSSAKFACGWPFPMRSARLVPDALPSSALSWRALIGETARRVSSICRRKPSPQCTASTAAAAAESLSAEALPSPGSGLPASGFIEHDPRLRSRPAAGAVVLSDAELSARVLSEPQSRELGAPDLAPARCSTPESPSATLEVCQSCWPVVFFTDCCQYYIMDVPRWCSSFLTQTFSRGQPGSGPSAGRRRA